MTAIGERVSTPHAIPQLQLSEDHESRKKGGALRPRAMLTTDWRKLAIAARRERDPKKFAWLLKQLYDVVNHEEKEPIVSRKPKLRLAKAA